MPSPAVAEERPDKSPDRHGPLFVRRESGDLLLSSHLAAALGAPSGELAVLQYLLEHQERPEEWVDVDRKELAARARTSQANIRRALQKLARLGWIEQKRPRSPLWRIRPQLMTQDPAERGGMAATR